MKSSWTPRTQAHASSARDGHVLEAKRGLQYQTLAIRAIDQGQYAKRPPVEQLIMHEVHAPVLRLIGRWRRRPAVQGHVRRSTPWLPQLQNFPAIHPSHALCLRRTSVAAQPHVRSLIANPCQRRLKMGHAVGGLARQVSGGLGATFSSLGGGSGRRVQSPTEFDVLPQSVAVPADVRDVAVVHESVDECRGHDLVP